MLVSYIKYIHVIQWTQFLARIVSYPILSNPILSYPIVSYPAKKVKMVFKETDDSQLVYTLSLL